MDKYQKRMKILAHNLFRTILNSLDLSEPEKNWAAAVYDSGYNALQLNTHPACPDENHRVLPRTPTPSSSPPSTTAK
ncbi:hypothetical protein RHMOL_Rhmol02G0236800 [Rhododendron molle]|uniref:Uncharacterized protein n=1 Tax=Rhododendron molle TaxID=49168 RepID=A0ACC0PW47_RHOML|nr:hypothetical protein RHMOL_Rhmol02G0236800 [Rhododendron molle]